MGDVITGDFGEGIRTRARLDSLTAGFMEWVTPLLDATDIQGDRLAACEAIYRDLAHQLATTYADVTVKM